MVWAYVAEAALTLAPLIAEFFSGKGDDGEGAQKIAQARDGLAARIAEAQRIPLAKAQEMVDAELKPIIDQHAQDSASNGAGLAAGVASAVGAGMLGRRIGGAAKLAKGALAAEKVAAKEAPVVAEGVLTARQKARQEMAAAAGRGEMDNVRGVSGDVPRLGHTPIREVEAELIDNTPPNARGQREYITPTDRFTMSDPEPRRLGFTPRVGDDLDEDDDPIPSIEDIMRHRAAMRRLGGV